MATDFRIDGPGFYRKRNGDKCEIIGVSRGFAIGWTRDVGTSGGAFSWDADTGKFFGVDKPECDNDIVSRWPRFSISDHGRGVYETLTGKEAKVLEVCVNVKRQWVGEVGMWKNVRWNDDGIEDAVGHSLNLVRYIGPLPKSEEPEQWVPTWELEWHKCPHNVRGATIVSTEDHALNEVCRLERKWTCGDKSEWRPIPVVAAKEEK